MRLYALEWAISPQPKKGTTMSEVGSKPNGHTDLRALIGAGNNDDAPSESASDLAMAKVITALATVLESQGADIVGGARTYFQAKLEIEKQRLENDKARIDKELDLRKDESKDQRGLTTRAVILYSVIAGLVIVGLIVLGLQRVLPENVLSTAFVAIVTGVFVTVLGGRRS
jgi:hypothetical protein